MLKKPLAEPAPRSTPTEVRADALKLITLIETERSECVWRRSGLRLTASEDGRSERSLRSCPTPTGCATTVRALAALEPRSFLRRRGDQATDRDQGHSGALDRVSYPADAAATARCGRLSECGRRQAGSGSDVRAARVRHRLTLAGSRASATRLRLRIQARCLDRWVAHDALTCSSATRSATTRQARRSTTTRSFSTCVGA